MNLLPRVLDARIQFLTMAIALLAPIVVSALEPGSRILATGGATQLEGAAGGGIVPWAVIAGYGQQGETGGDIFATHVSTDDFELDAYGIALGLANRLELSLARQRLDIDKLGLPVAKLEQDVIGVKLRLFGDLVYDRWPQLSVGMQYKHNKDFLIPSLAGAVDDDGVDAYLSASRLWLAGIGGYPLLFSATARHSKANQLGLLGFGGDLGNNRELLAEASLGVLLRRNLLLAVEYRQKPDNLGFAREDDWKDIFLAWFPHKKIAVIGAWTQLGSIAGFDHQDGLYLSIRGSL